MPKPSHVFLRLSGGLGNQLFQLAATTLLLDGELRSARVITDSLRNYKSPRDPDALRLLALPAWQPGRAPAWERAVAWATSTARAGRWLPGAGVNDRTVWSHVDSPTAPHMLLVDGYFQAGWTRQRMQRVLSAWLPQAPGVVEPARDSTGECLIHIRGGDFLTLPQYQVADLEFYSRAVALAHEAGWERFAVMSDDPRHAAGIAEQIRARHGFFGCRHLPPGQDTLADFDTLRRAPARIIGNSTFAWWAAAMDVKHATTWAPDQFLKGIKRDFTLDHERTLAV